MKRIGVITINDFNNYGNRLQCYALQRFLEDMGLISENIYNTYDRDSIIVYGGKRFLRFLRNIGRTEIISARKQSFQSFNKRIRFSEERIINGKYSKDINGKYDFFITGSDQVWNPCDCGRSEIDFLSFANKEKKIAFSASMGVREMPSDRVAEYREYLRDFKWISVREQAAKKIVEDLTGRSDIELLIDPTMLLTAQEWELVLERPDIPHPSKYILVYFLGRDPKWRQVISRMSTEYGCEIIDIYDKSSIYYSCGPQHFLYLVKNAYLICTDSFHCAAFSLIFNKPFVAFDRLGVNMDMNSRLETLLNKFGINQNRYKAGKDIRDYLNWDYTEGYKMLVQEREKARDFLVRALS